MPVCVQHMQIAVFGGLHDYVTEFAVDLDVGKSHLLNGVVIPLVGRRGLATATCTRYGEQSDEWNKGCPWSWDRSFHHRPPWPIPM